MKNLLIIAAMALICGSLSARSDRSAKEAISDLDLDIVYGVDWSGTLLFHSSAYRLYVTEDGFLVEDPEDYFNSHVCGSLGVYGGVSVRKKIQACLHAGYAGFRKGIRMIPVGVDAKIFLRRSDRPGFFGILDGAVGIPLRAKDRTSLVSGLGIGYRESLSRAVSIDYSCSMTYGHTHPYDFMDKYAGKPVVYDNIRTSNSSDLGIRLAVALNF